MKRVITITITVVERNRQTLIKNIQKFYLIIKTNNKYNCNFLGIFKLIF